MSAYGPLPRGCAARFREVNLRVTDLWSQFHTGNRDIALDHLLEMEPKAALAVLAGILVSSPEDMQKSIHNYLREKA